MLGEFEIFLHIFPLMFLNFPDLREKIPHAGTPFHGSRMIKTIYGAKAYDDFRILTQRFKKNLKNQ